MATSAPGAAAATPAARLLHRGVARAELFDFTAEDLADCVVALRAALAAEGRPRLSFHVPVPRPPGLRAPGVACHYLCEHASLRARSFRILEDTIAAARTWGAEYVVTHLTYGRTDTRDPGRARRLAREACARMAELSRAYALPVDVEFAAYTDAFHEPQAFLDALAPHPELGLCIDTGHAFIGAERHGRNYLDDILALAPRARSMHLWNTRGAAHCQAYGHTPLHPSQTPAAGWIDIETTLAVVLEANPDTALVFEYPVAELTAEIQAGFDWIERLVRRLTRR